MYFDILFISDFVQQVTSHKKLFVFATPDTEDLVQVIVSNVPMRYPTYYIWSVMRTVQSTRVPSINW